MSRSPDGTPRISPDPTRMTSGSTGADSTGFWDSPLGRRSGRDGINLQQDLASIRKTAPDTNRLPVRQRRADKSYHKAAKSGQKLRESSRGSTVLDECPTWSVAAEYGLSETGALSKHAVTGSYAVLTEHLRGTYVVPPQEDIAHRHRPRGDVRTLRDLSARRGSADRPCPRPPSTGRHAIPRGLERPTNWGMQTADKPGTNGRQTAGMKPWRRPIVEASLGRRFSDLSQAIRRTGEPGARIEPLEHPNNGDETFSRGQSPHWRRGKGTPKARQLHAIWTPRSRRSRAVPNRVFSAIQQRGETPPVPDACPDRGAGTSEEHQSDVSHGLVAKACRRMTPARCQRRGKDRAVGYC